MSRRPLVLSLLVVQQQRLPVPLQFSMYYRDRFAGSNNALKSHFLGPGIQIFV